MTEPSPEELAALRNEGDFDGVPVPARVKPFHSLTRPMPCATESEMALLSCFLLMPREVGGLCAEKRITREHFYDARHSLIYGRMMDLWIQNQPLELPLLTQDLHDREELTKAGGGGYLTELFCFRDSPSNAGRYADVLSEQLTLRAIITLGCEYASAGFDERHDAPGLLSRFERDVLAIARGRTLDGCNGKELALIGLAEIDRRMALGSNISGLSTGFHGLDMATDGLHSEEMIVIGAVPSLGKSALAMQIIDHLCVDLTIPCAVFTLEMGRRQLSQRMIYTRARVNPVPWREGARPSEFDRSRMAAAASRIGAAPLYVEDGSDLTIQEIRAKLRRLVRDKDVRVAMIDSLSALHSDTRQGRDSRVREAAECSEGCKQAAKELGITVILVAHIDKMLPRNERPNASHLRESGKVAIDADSLWFLYEPDFDEATPSSEPEIDIWIPKQRDGEPFVSRKLTFLKRFTRFVESTDGQPSGPQTEEFNGIDFGKLNG